MFWQLYDAVNDDLLQEDLCHTHTQSPCPLTLPERSFWWSRMVTALFFHKTVEWTLTVGNWSEEPKVTPCWNCFFDLLVVAIVIIIEHNGLPQKTLPFSLIANVPFLSSLGDKLTLHTYEKKKLTHTFQRLAHWDVLQDWKSILLYFLNVSSSLFCLLTLVSHNFSPSGSIKEPGLQTLTRWFLRDISLPSSQPTVQRKSYSLPPHLSQIHWSVSCTTKESICHNKDPSYDKTKILCGATKTQHRQINT